jgi:parallel beta-helix repeat protein
MAGRLIRRIAGVACIGLLTSTAFTLSASATGSSQTLVVTNLNDTGPGSFRKAIETANATPPTTSTVVHFAVHGTIGLASDLPAVVKNVAVDGRSAPTYMSGGPPVVEINALGHEGLQFAPGSNGSQLLALAVDNAAGNGITLNASSITLNLNYIGLNLSGAALGNHGDGVLLSPVSSNNRVGLNTSGASGAVANVISGNTGSGLRLSGSSGNIIVANRIGTNPAGSAAIANGRDGISLTGGSNSNRLGGPDFVDSTSGMANNPTGSKGTVPAVFVVPPLGNLVSGNLQNGIAIASKSQSNVLNGNFVGTTANGDGAIANGLDGVSINGSDNNQLIGCQFVNNPFVYYNIMANNGRNGLHITNSNNVTVQANFFGVGANNTNILPNQLDGILVDGSSRNTQVGGVIPLGNVSAGNLRNGIEVRDTVNGFITFNTFGGLLAFKGAAPNGNDGLLVTSAGGNNEVRTNVFSGNHNNGIELAGNASGVKVDPNIVGLTTNGKTALANGGDGLLIRGTAHNNIIGGTTRSVIPQNTFSGNVGYGVAIRDQANSNMVLDTFIGTEIAGVNALANQKGGLVIGGSANHNLIGVADTNPSNLISGNTGNGVTLGAGTSRNLVTSNFIGLNRLRQPLPNSGLAVANTGTLNLLFGNSIFP